jgi:DNA-binding NarL/FixJ family response regulator
MTDIHILVVEDDPLIAEDICFYLQDAGYKNSLVAYNWESAIYILNNQTVDFIFLDYHLNDLKSGVDIAKEINLNYHLPFAFITSYSDKKSIDEIKVLHPVGYIVKPFNGKDIPAVLQLGLELYYSYMEHKGVFDITKLNVFLSDSLTSKELEVVMKLLEGKRNQQISDELFVSINTTKTHLKNIFIKMNVTSRTEAMSILSRCK